MTAKKNMSNAEMLKGTLDMMILRTLLTGMRTHTIAKASPSAPLAGCAREVEQGSSVSRTPQARHTVNGLR